MILESLLEKTQLQEFCLRTALPFLFLASEIKSRSFLYLHGQISCQTAGSKEGEAIKFKLGDCPQEPLGSAGCQTCCIADFQVGRHKTLHERRVWKPATQQTWNSALHASTGSGAHFLGALASRRRVPVFGFRLAGGTPALPGGCVCQAAPVATFVMASGLTPAIKSVCLCGQFYERFQTSAR
jgi:hypothetical protein